MACLSAKAKQASRWNTVFRLAVAPTMDSTARNKLYGYVQLQQ